MSEDCSSDSDCDTPPKQPRTTGVRAVRGLSRYDSPSVPLDQLVSAVLMYLLRIFKSVFGIEWCSYF